MKKLFMSMITTLILLTNLSGVSLEDNRVLENARGSDNPETICIASMGVPIFEIAVINGIKQKQFIKCDYQADTGNQKVENTKGMFGGIITIFAIFILGKEILTMASGQSPQVKSLVLGILLLGWENWLQILPKLF